MRTKRHRSPDASTPLAIALIVMFLIALAVSLAVQPAHAANRPPHYSMWICIHHYEGAWNANTGNGYYGGLQMDYEFMRDYGAKLLRVKGTADHWTPLEQMWVAERAWRTRGFWPWPNTARYCGLL